MRRTLPLWICFAVAVLAFTGAFTGSLWTTLNQAAISSVEELSGVFQATVMRDLEHRLLSVLDRMLVMLNDWRDFPQIERSTVEEVHAFTYAVLCSNPAVEGMFYARPNGEAMGSTRIPPGGIWVGLQMPTQRNLTYYSYNGTLGSKYSSFPFDSHLRPWYVDAVEAQGPVFTYSFRGLVTQEETIALSSAVYYPNSSVAAVLTIAFAFSALSDQLAQAHLELQSSGMMVLMEQGNGVAIAAATASRSTLDADIEEVRSVVLGNTKEYDTLHRRFRTFGDAVVVQTLISPDQASGLQWKLVVVLPDADYYTRIWKLNLVAGAEAGGILAAFLGTVVLMSYGLLTRPLRILTCNIDQLRQTLLTNDGISFSHTVSTDLLAEGRISGISSRFTEVNALYQSVVTALEAAAQVSVQRAQEAAQTAELRRAEEETQSLMKAKESFFAVMSHEMRTPLTACIGMAEVLRDTTTLDPRQKECVDAVLSNGGSMLSLINDILDFSKMEADRLELEIAPFSLREVVEQAACTVQVRAEEKGLQLVVRVRPEVPRKVVGDARRLKRVLLNLLSNGVKFTHEGVVSISCAVDEGRQWFTVEVQDTGIGLSEAALQRLFQPFSQADSSITRRYGGTGLG
eukprot:RCo026071